VVADDRTFGAFLSVLAFAKWQWEYATASVSTRSFPKPKGVVNVVPWDPAVPLTGTGKPAKGATKPAPRKVAKKPVEPKPSAAHISETAALQSATLRSMLGKPATPHPDSPFGDDIPF
jgi:hypothetical protein